MTETLAINDLHVAVESKPILRGVTLQIRRGETHALMGPNGSGKSTLGLAIMGHPNYEVTSGTITIDGVDLLELSPDKRARQGVFMAFQRPMAIPGVKMADFLRHATTNVRNPNRKEGEELIPMREFRKELKAKMDQLKIDQEFARRYVNDGFSGGEMKRAEILQMAMLQPRFAILDETDSGLDADAVRLASQSIAEIRGGQMGLLIITHHEKLLEHNPPDVTHVMLGGRIVETGGPELAIELHKHGFERIRADHPDAAAEERAMAEAEAVEAPHRNLIYYLFVIDTPPRSGDNAMATDLTTSNSFDPAHTEINKYDFKTKTQDVFKAKKGLNREVVAQISEMKNEPAWMRDFRLKSLEIFESKPMPTWGGDIAIDFQDVYYYLKPTDHQGKSWDDVPAEIKETFDRLGIPEAEKKFLAGVKAQFESEVVYGSLQEDLAKQGVIFTDTDTALREHEDLLREHFATVIPPTDNKFAALNSAVWSGGSFIYVPKGVNIEFPLQAYFRINAESMGQFERTLILVDEGAKIHYVEGCTAPMYTTESLHSAVVEIKVMRGARCRYTTIQNWANNIYNLVTKRAMAYRDATMEWIDGNLGSRLTMKYPAVYMMEPGARGEILSIAFSSAGQHQDAGAKLVHCAPHTSGRIISKSISKNGGRSSYRGLVKVEKGAVKSKSNVVCDALILDSKSRSDTYPYIEIDEQDVSVGHEASVSRIGEEQLFYLTSRGLTEAEASTMIVSGFIEPLVKELPMEYAVEMNRLIELQMEGSVG